MFYFSYSLLLVSLNDSVKVIVFNAVNENAYSPIDLTVFGIETASKDSHDSEVKFSIAIIVLGMSIWCRFSQK